MHKLVFDDMIVKIQKFAEEVFSSNDVIFKSRLKEAFEKLAKTNINDSSTKSKRLPIRNLFPNPKKKKNIEDLSIKVELPNEIWMKIVKYLPSKDVYGSVALINKRFNGLSFDSGVTKCIKISNKYFAKKKMNILKNSKGPIEIINDMYDESAIINALKATEKLKSLKLSSGKIDVQTLGNHTVTAHSDLEISMNLIKNLKESKNHLEHLEVKEIYIWPEVMIEISKIRTLKTLKITHSRRVVLTLEVINALAENDNQLETVELDDISQFPWHIPNVEFCNQLKVSWSNFMTRKSNTLKSLRIISISHEIVQDISFEDFRKCHKLEEFCGNLILSKKDIDLPSALPKLKMLQIKDLRDPKYLLNNLNLTNLKYLAIHCSTLPKNVILGNQLGKHYFPALERLRISCKLDQHALENLISKTPRLKSIQFEVIDGLPFSNKFLYDMCNDRNIIVVFGKIIGEKLKVLAYHYNESRFDNFLSEYDFAMFGKYNKMKHDFLEWCQNNPDYGYSQLLI